MDPTLLELASTGGPWAWAVLTASGLLWLPTLALAVMAATGRRIPTASFLLLILFLFLLASFGSWVGVVEVQAAIARADVGDRIRLAGLGLELAWIPLILASRLSPTLVSVGALGLAIGAWLRAPDSRFTAPKHAILPVLLGGLGIAAAVFVDGRIAVAAACATLALGLVSAPSDDEPVERRRLASRRAGVSVLGLAAVGLAVAGAVATSIARADGNLAVENWPQASLIAFYAPSAVLQRHAVLPAGLAPVGLVGLAGLASVFPLSSRLGGVRAWAGGIAVSVVALLIVGIGLTSAATHSATWREVLPPRTHVAVPRVERARPARIAKRLTWTPRGALIDGTPVHRLALGSTSAQRAPIPAHLDVALVTALRDAVDARRDPSSYWPQTRGRPHGWDLEVAAIARAEGVKPLFQALIAEDPFALAHGVNLVVAGPDGFPTTIPAQLTAEPQPDTILVSGDASWDDLVDEVVHATAAGRIPTLGVPAD